MRCLLKRRRRSKPNHKLRAAMRRSMAVSNSLLRSSACATTFFASSRSYFVPTAAPAKKGVASPSETVAAMGKKKLKRLKRQQQQQEAEVLVDDSVSRGAAQRIDASSSAGLACGGDRQQPASSSKSTAPSPKRLLPDEAYTSFNRVMPIRAFRELYDHLKPGEQLLSSTNSETTSLSSPDNNGKDDQCANKGKVSCRVGGRVVSIRDLGKLLFISIRSANESLQVCARVGFGSFSATSLQELKDKLTSGDIVGVEGVPGKSKKGELTIFAHRVDVLAPYVCADLTVVPDQRIFSSAVHVGHERQQQTDGGGTGATTTAGGGSVSDPELKYRYRFVDMIADPGVLDIFKARHRMIQQLRQFLNARGFIEVETPTFHTVPSGANARPFSTHHNANGTDLFLRVAPELHLKQCVVGGLELVYEIGKVFRNEDTDKSHNPEFTSCEFYAAYHTYEDLMVMTELLLRDLAISVRGEPSMEVPVNRHSSDDSPVCDEAGKTPSTAATSASASDTTWFRIDLTKPFRRVSVYDAIQTAAGVELPPPKSLDSPMGIAFMAAIMLKHNIPFPTVRTASKYFDKLIDHFVTDHIVEPTFVCDHPLFMSPLAKEHATRPGLSERFELFISGMEVCNAYSELNDPQEQLRRFEQQLKDKHNGDDEAMNLDETFLKSLQTGMPPTAGWGMGVDRMVMLLTKRRTIRDVIIFPLLRPDESSNDVKRRRKTASFFGFNQQMMLFCLSALEAELQRRGQLGMKTEHLKAMRQTVLELNRRRNALEVEFERCREVNGSTPCGLVQRLLYRVLCGGSKH